MVRWLYHEPRRTSQRKRYRPIQQRRSTAGLVAARPIGFRMRRTMTMNAAPADGSGSVAARSGNSPLPTRPHGARTDDRVEHPHWAWWLSIVSGMSLLAVLALSADAYALWAGQVTTVFSQPLLRLMLIGAVAAHIGESLYAFRLAGQLGLHATRSGWAAQTLILGFPSLRLLLARRRAASAAA